MKNSILGLGLGILLMAVCAAILLVSDWNRRVVAPDAMPVVSIFQFASRDVLDAGVDGCVDALSERGFQDGRTIRIKRFNAEADFTAGNSIAKAILEGGGKMVVTFSTPALQIMAGANKDGRLIHLFGIVTDPFVSGVGLSRSNPEKRPDHLAGIGTFQPVKEVWRLAARINPAMKKVGVVWCTSETCSEACTILAREVAKELGAQLLESPISSSSEIPDAVRSLLARGIEALWMGGDNIVEAAAPSVINIALEAGIPTFANAPMHAENGALIGLGADYYQVGRALGNMAADVLKGRKPGEIPIENLVPPQLFINTNVLARLKNPKAWTPAPDVMASAARVIGAPKNDAGAVAAGNDKGAPPVAIKKVGIFYYGPDPMVERGISGFTNGLIKLCKENNFKVEFVVQHAQSDFSQIPQLIKQMDEAGFDILTPMTTPCLTATVGMARKTPVVFAIVYDPVAAGAGRDFTNHLPNVTGVGCFPPLEETMDYIRRLVPGVKKIGTIYNPAEANSCKAVQIADEILAKRGITLEKITVMSVSELNTAALAVVQRGIDALWITGDNTVLSGFSAVATVAKNARLAVVCNDLVIDDYGAVAAVGADFYESGYAAAAPALRVLKGEDPGSIPFSNVSISRVAMNPAYAREIGLALNNEAIAAADELSGPPVKKMRVALIEQIEAPSIEETRKGFLDGLSAAGMRENRDYTLRRLNAQGEISMLDGMVDTALAEPADIIATITTPALQTAMRKVKDRPVVFALSVDPLLIGDSGTHTQHQPNVTGVYDTSPFHAMLALIKECLPAARRIGTLFTPSEMNSRIFKDYFERAAKEQGMEVVAVSAESVLETGPAALALANKGVDVICQINDNQSNAAFPAVASAARSARIPLFAFSSGLVEQGASLTLANDQYEGGRQAGILMARVMRGQTPASLPYSQIHKTRLAVNLDAARAIGLALPAAVVGRADRVIDSSAPQNAGPAQKTAKPARLAQKHKIRMINYVDAPHVDEVVAGLVDAFNNKGWKEGVDYELKMANAQGDVAALIGLLAAAADEKPDALLITSSSALQAAIQRVPEAVPIVFGSVASPTLAGAGKSNTDHKPNVTGISTEGDFAGMARVVKQCFPSARAVGTLFTPSEMNSVFYRQRFEEELNKIGLKLVALPVSTPAEVAESADALAQANITAICQIMDNLGDAAFAAIAGAARRQRMPLFCFVTTQVFNGNAALAVARDYQQVGRDMADVTELLFNGQSPAAIPIRPVSKTTLAVNLKTAEYFGIVFPKELLDSAIVAKE